MIQNWSIRTRSHQCAQSGRPFEEGDVFHTAIYFDPETHSIRFCDGMAWRTISQSPYRWTGFEYNTCPPCGTPNPASTINCVDLDGTVVDPSLCGNNPKPLEVTGQYSDEKDYSNCSGAHITYSIVQRLSVDGTRYEYNITYRFQSDYSWDSERSSGWFSAAPFYSEYDAGRDHPWIQAVPTSELGPLHLFLGSCKGNDDPYRGYEEKILFIDPE